MLRKLSRRKMLGFALVEVMAVSAIMTTMSSQGAGNYRYAVNAANKVAGVSNLQQIYDLLMIEDMTNGALPSAAFYPKDDPKKDPKSILVQLPNAPSALFVSPFAPDELKKKGLTFAWNDAVNGKSLTNLPKDTWLLVDLAAFIADPNTPKPASYLILYADRRALAVADLPEDIKKAVAEAQAKQKADELTKQAPQEQTVQDAQWVAKQKAEVLAKQKAEALARQKAMEEAKRQAQAAAAEAKRKAAEEAARLKALEAAKQQEQTKPASAVIYTCPMHPEVQQDHPGNCPKCGMALVQKAQEQK